MRPAHCREEKRVRAPIDDQAVQSSWSKSISFFEPVLWLKMVQMMVDSVQWARSFGKESYNGNLMEIS